MMSGSVMTETSEVSFSSTIQLLPRPGSATRSSCGKTTRRKRLRLVQAQRRRQPRAGPCGWSSARRPRPRWRRPTSTTPSATMPATKGGIEKLPGRPSSAQSSCKPDLHAEIDDVERQKLGHAAEHRGVDRREPRGTALSRALPSATMQPEREAEGQRRQRERNGDHRRPADRRRAPAAVGPKPSKAQLVEHEPRRRREETGSTAGAEGGAAERAVVDQSVDR